MDRSVERALRACGAVAPDVAVGLLDDVRARLFGTAPRRVRLGRYEVIARVGAGGGGVVLRALDPRLRRPVAIKLVHAHGGEHAQVRLLREARALARLSHPNVVAVFDVGRVDVGTDLARFVGPGVDRTVYLVMEWLDGDLARWLHERRRSWPEIVGAFVAAGRGLQAAHAAGLLHRDFKPHNVLRDRDGRLCVADFGLTRAGPTTNDGPDDHEMRSPAITSVDDIVGTPIYMAPEQHLGGTVDERTDQYSFCLSLHEALWGPRPSSSLAALVAGKLAGPPAMDRRRVPGAIVQALTRGLQPNAERRFPSMAELLAVLDRARPRPLRRIFAVGAAIATLGAAASRIDAPPLCDGDDPAWTAVWADRREAIAAAWDTRAGPFGRASFAAIDERMSAAGQRWSDARAHVCVAEPDPARTRCLEDRRRRAAALVDAWQDAAVDGIAGAIQATDALASVDECLAVRPQAASDDELASAAARVEALVAASRTTEADALADALEPGLGSVSDAAAIAPLFAIALARERAGRHADAEQTLVELVHRAEALDDAEAVVRAAASLVTIVGADMGRTEDGARWGRHAWAGLARTQDDGDLRALVHDRLGQLAMARGDGQVALEHYTAAVELASELRTDDDLERASMLADLAGAWMQLGRYDEAIAIYEDVIAVQERQLGAHHPATAMTWHNLANPLALTGRLDRARDAATRALDDWVAAFGEEHPHVALALQTLGVICNQAHEPATALPHLERAHRLRLQLLGEEHRDTLTTEMTLANTYDALGRVEDARVRLAHVAEAYEHGVTGLPHHGLVLMNLGNAQRRTGQLELARTTLLRALEVGQAQFGPTHVVIGMTLLNLAMTEGDLDDFAAATRTFERAEAVMLASVGPHHPRLALVHLERGRLAARTGDRRVAAEAYARGLAALAGTEHSDVERAALRSAQRELAEQERDAAR